MSNTYTSLLYHLVFSTKGREHWLNEDIQPRVWAYIGGIARENDMTALSVGGVTDHIHALVLTKPTILVSRMLQLLKGGSSLWIHETFPQLKRFAWQDGYGAFTVSKSDLVAQEWFSSAAGLYVAHQDVMNTPQFILLTNTSPPGSVDIPILISSLLI